MNSHCGVRASAQKIAETTKLLQICHIFKIKRIHFKIYVDELKWRINSE